MLQATLVCFLSFRVATSLLVVSRVWCFAYEQTQLRGDEKNEEGAIIITNKNID